MIGDVAKKLAKIGAEVGGSKKDRSFKKDDSDGSDYEFEEKIKLGRGADKGRFKEVAETLRKLTTEQKAKLRDRGEKASARLMDRKSARIKY